MKKSNAKILVTGGAGYIGGCAALCLKEAGYQVFIIDNLVTGHQETLDALEIPHVKGDVGDSKTVAEVCKKFKPDAVIHFAAHAYVGESVTAPEKYYRNNVAQSIDFLSTLNSQGVKSVVFSSTCATYGDVTSPIAETVPQNPVNPYGRTKLVIENVLKDFDQAYGMKFIAFRYFNVAGAHQSLLIGERHNPETHLIPRAVFAGIGGPKLDIFGTDYPTPDGTCIRDYVHVQDIAEAHILGVDYLLSGNSSDAFNIGTGVGHSCLEVINSVEKATGKKVPWNPKARRPGDPPQLFAASQKIQKMLGWKPKFATLDSIVDSSVRWYSKHPEIVC